MATLALTFLSIKTKLHRLKNILYMNKYSFSIKMNLMDVKSKATLFCADLCNLYLIQFSV